MQKTTRRNVLKVVAAGGASAALGLTLKRGTVGEGVLTAAAQNHSHKPISGPLANATVNFGQWETDPPFDRFTNPTPPPPNTRNHHALLPNEVTIQAGGSVNFIIGGFHLVLVYDHGTQPADIDPDLLVSGSSPPGLIDDPEDRIFRGVDPRTVPQDRVETVHFPKAGTYLVMCGVRPHFVNDNMFGYVKVLP
jgi:hypothetical protein